MNYEASCDSHSNFHFVVCSFPFRGAFNSVFGVFASRHHLPRLHAIPVTVNLLQLTRIITQVLETSTYDDGTSIVKLIVCKS